MLKGCFCFIFAFFLPILQLPGSAAVCGTKWTSVGREQRWLQMLSFFLLMTSKRSAMTVFFFLGRSSLQELYRLLLIDCWFCRFPCGHTLYYLSPFPNTLFLNCAEIHPGQGFVCSLRGAPTGWLVAVSVVLPWWKLRPKLLPKINASFSPVYLQIACTSATKHEESCGQNICRPI